MATGQTRVDQDLHVGGTLSAKNFTPPNSSITNAAIQGAAGIDSSKLDHRFRKHYAISGSAASVTIPLHVARAAGVINSIEAGSIVVCTSTATVTVDLKKNGTSVLSGGTPITLNSSNTVRVAVSGTITTTTYVDGDFFELVIVATAGGGAVATGLMVDVEFDEEAQ